MFSKRSFWVIFFFVLAVAAIAAEYTVKGSIKNSDGEPEAFATIRIFNANDTIKPVTLGTSTENGSFSLNVPASGRYRLVISATGKKSIDTQVELNSENKSVSLDDMTMADMAMELGAVEVVAQRPLVSKEIDRIGYDVQADDEAKTSTIQGLGRPRRHNQSKRLFRFQDL